MSAEKDVIFSKINIVKNCLMAIEKVQSQEKDMDFRQGLFERNLQRAIQACIDIAMCVLSRNGLGLPNNYKQAFFLLQSNGIIDIELSKKMVSMVGFRNISVHDYETIKPEIVNSIIQKHLVDFDEYNAQIFKHINSWH